MSLEGIVLKKLIILSSLLLLVGCNTIPNRELNWQGLHLIDVLQTSNAAGNDTCYEEVNPLTRGLIGAKPHKDKVYIWGVLWGLGHVIVTKAVDESKIPKWLKTTFHVLDFTGKGLTISSNHNDGIRVWGDNTPPEDPDLHICEEQMGNF